MAERTCERCGTPFAAKGVKRFCTERCRSRTEGERRSQRAPSKTCAHCSAEFRCRQSKRYCSLACANAARVTPCTDCGEPIAYRTICRSCKHERILRRLERRSTRSTRRWYAGLCRNCGDAYVDHQPARNFCTARCSKAHHRKHAKYRRRALVTATRTEPLSTAKVYERDGWRCKLCGRKVRKDTSTWHPMMVTLDHIVPLHAGGTHTYDNVQCAHAICNAIKGNRGSDDLRPDQLLLLG